jgi:hypothetical protein
MSSLQFTYKRNEPVNVLFDDEDDAWVLGLPSRRVVASGKKLYATCVIQNNKVVTRHFIARLIGGLLPKDCRETDHINGDSLDNRRANLRIVTRQMQQQNLSPHSEYRGAIPSSSYRGVCWSPPRRRWLVYAQVCGKRVYGGSYLSEETAACTAKDLRASLVKEALAGGLLTPPEPVPPLASNLVLLSFLASIPRGHYKSRETHCKNGHPFDEQNTSYNDKGGRGCRACRLNIDRRYREKHSKPKGA